MPIGVRTTKILSLSLPPALVRQAERIAREEGRTRSELFREALRRYVLEREWRTLQRYGRAQARQRGIAGRGVNRLIREYRSGR